jgi:hypothetical protein
LSEPTVGLLGEVASALVRFPNATGSVLTHRDSLWTQTSRSRFGMPQWLPQVTAGTASTWNSSRPPGVAGSGKSMEMLRACSVQRPPGSWPLMPYPLTRTSRTAAYTFAGSALLTFSFVSLKNTSTSLAGNRDV